MDGDSLGFVRQGVDGMSGERSPVGNREGLELALLCAEGGEQVWQEEKRKKSHGRGPEPPPQGGGREERDQTPRALMPA